VTVLPKDQRFLDGLPVYEFGKPQIETASEWIGESVRLGRRLTATEAESIGEADGFRLANVLPGHRVGYVLDGDDGWRLVIVLRSERTDDAPR
jgi:hypothetical protein